MQSKKYKLSRVYEEAAVPAGWVQNVKDNARGRAFSNYVVRAVDAGKVRCVCYGGATKTCAGGKYFIHPEDMRLLEQQWDDREAEKSTDSMSDQSFAVGDDRIDAVCKSLASIDTTLDEIYRVLERLTSAVENIATNPPTPPQELMQTINGNGFHS